MIREAVIGDFDVLQEIVREIQQLHAKGRPDVFIEVSDPLEFEEFKKLIADEDARVFVYEADGCLAGYCILRIRESQARPIMKASRYVYINDFAVRKSYWRKGVGRGLFEHVKGFASETGADSIQLMVWDFNDNAVAFYEAMGMDTRIRIMELPAGA